jgi:adenine-specific DNA-methyltransferase
MDADALETYRLATKSSGFTRLQAWGETSLGAVTGNNDYFTLTASAVARHKLNDADVLKISPPGARHLRGLTFSLSAWNELVREDSRCFLFWPAPGRLSKSAKAYISMGEELGVNTAYKCRVRSPWWRVPVGSRPDLFFTYMNHDRPRLATNDARALILNSLYGVHLKEENRKIGKANLPLACMNTLTLLGSEIVGRAYGGGLLKHEPKEADLLPVPCPSVLKIAQEELQLLKPQLATILRQNKLLAAVEMVDSILLEKHLGLTRDQLALLRRSREALFNRRLSRGRINRVES